jgi:hypothetical protein
MPRRRRRRRRRRTRRLRIDVVKKNDDVESVETSHTERSKFTPLPIQDPSTIINSPVSFAMEGKSVVSAKLSSIL